MAKKVTFQSVREYKCGGDPMDVATKQPLATGLAPPRSSVAAMIEFGLVANAVASIQALLDDFIPK